MRKDDIGGIDLDDRYAFSRRERDDESALMHYRARSYDPRLGRFAQKDPPVLRRARHHYVYSNNAPTLWIDPHGQDEFQRAWLTEQIQKKTLTDKEEAIARAFIDYDERADDLAYEYAGGWKRYPSWVHPGETQSAWAYWSTAQRDWNRLSARVIWRYYKEVYGADDPLDVLQPGWQENLPVGFGCAGLGACAARIVGRATRARPPILTPKHPSILEAIETGVIKVVSAGAAGVKQVLEHLHHVFPQGLRRFFKKRGFNDIDDFLIRLDEGTHRALHAGDRTGGWWNREIKNRILDRERALQRKLSREEVIEQGKKMLQEHKLDDRPFVKKE